jgi:hypothetical protein
VVLKDLTNLAVRDAMQAIALFRHMFDRIISLVDYPYEQKYEGTIGSFKAQN